MTFEVNDRESAIEAINVLMKGYDLKYSDLDNKEDEKKWLQNVRKNIRFGIGPETLRSVMTEMECHCETCTNSIMKKLQEFPYERRHELVQKGIELMNEARTSGARTYYRHDDELAVIAVKYALYGSC